MILFRFLEEEEEGDFINPRREIGLSQQLGRK